MQGRLTAEFGHKTISALVLQWQQGESDKKIIGGFLYKSRKVV